MSDLRPFVDNDAPVHACPPVGSGGIMPCCGRTPFEVRAHRIATDPALVTCWTGSDSARTGPTVTRQAEHPVRAGSVRMKALCSPPAACPIPPEQSQP